MSATSIDLGTVLRHHRAMSVVDLVEDEPVRWTPLEYVLACSPAVEAATSDARRPCRPGAGRPLIPLERYEPRVKAIASRPVASPTAERAGMSAEQAQASWQRASARSPFGVDGPMRSPLASRSSRIRPLLGPPVK